ncbi:MAG: type I-E CRISPR-associated protein Cas6/Cse3/CasE [Pseudomonadota bacterium]
MYFSRIRLQREGISAADLTKVLGEDGYGEHRAVWRLFSSPDRSNRDFLFRKELEHSRPIFYIVSRTAPSDTDAVWSVETKPYAPKIGAGERFAFALTANPVVTRWVGDEEKRHARHDVVMDAKRELDAKNVPNAERPNTPEIVQSAGFNWLASRASRCGFAIEKGLVRADGYRQRRFRKGVKGSEVQLSTLDFTGVLTVTEPQAFTEALFQGVGPAKGFGCGLLLIRRV